MDGARVIGRGVARSVPSRISWGSWIERSTPPSIIGRLANRGVRELELGEHLPRMELEIAGNEIALLLLERRHLLGASGGGDGASDNKQGYTADEPRDHLPIRDPAS